MRTIGIVSVSVILSVVCLAGCDPNGETEPASTADEEAAEPTVVEEEDSASQQGEPVEQSAAITSPESDWIDERVAASEERLSQTRGGEIISRAIETHGGLERWYRSRLLEFRFRYNPVEGGEGPTRDTVQTVDVWSSKARHQLTSDESAEFGWSGEKAWMTSEELRDMNPRFWALTPFYFVGIPFVLADEGVNLDYEGEWEFEGETWQMVRATFDDGTGDAPDDFYVVMVNKETGRVGGVRYVVSYPGFFPDGGHSPEKLLTYDGEQRAGGILFPKTFRSFPWEPSGNGTGEPGEQIREAEMSRIEWKESVPADYFAMPDGAIEQKEM
jgi:hypothetical protein